MDRTEDSSKGIVVVRRYLSMLALLGVLGATLYYPIQAQGYDFRWRAVFDFLPALSKGALRT
jgi:hypothetical protein